MPQPLVIVFVKVPRPGQVKTRLIPAVGAEAAAHLARVMAERVIRETAGVARHIAFAPVDAAAEMAAWLPGEVCRPQVEGDLGARMAADLADGFRAGFTPVAAVGADLPGLTRRTVDAAWQALHTCDVAIAPALDGGYGLLALRRPAPALFENVEWSTPRVLEQTRAAAAKRRLAVQLLEPLGDVDTLDDLRREWPLLRDLVGPKFRAVLEAAQRS